MRKNRIIDSKRNLFVEKGIKDSKEAADQLRKAAADLENSQTTTQKVQILSELLFLSEVTIWKILSQ